jgi:hypothetical protein
MLKTINYSNRADQKGNRKSIMIYSNVYARILNDCKGHFGAGGENKDSFYVDVNDWDKCLSIVNQGINSGFEAFVSKTTTFNIK